MTHDLDWRQWMAERAQAQRGELLARETERLRESLEGERGDPTPGPMEAPGQGRGVEPPGTVW